MQKFAVKIASDIPTYFIVSIICSIAYSGRFTSLSISAVF